MQQQIKIFSFLSFRFSKNYNLLNKKMLLNIGGKEKINRYDLYKNFNDCLIKNKTT